MGVEWTGDHAAQAPDDSTATERHQRHRPLDTWFEPHRRSRRDRQAEPSGRGSVKVERGVRLKEMKVRTNLDRTVAGVCHQDLDHFTTCKQLDRLIADDRLAGPDPARTLLCLHAHQPIGSCKVTNLVPSGNVASIWISGISSATPSITSARVSTLRSGLRPHRRSAGQSVPTAQHEASYLGGHPTDPYVSGS